MNKCQVIFLIVIFQQDYVFIITVVCQILIIIVILDNTTILVGKYEFSIKSEVKTMATQLKSMIALLAIKS